MPAADVLAFGGGFASDGSRLSIEFDAEGLSLTPGTRRIPWASITVTKSGWDGTQLRLEFEREGNRFALLASEPTAIARIAGAAAGRAQRASDHRPTRVWSATLIWITVVLPLVLVGTLLWQHDRILGWAIAQIPVEQERKLGEIAFEQHKATLKLIEGPARTMILDLGGRLSAGSRYTYEFHLADDRLINAFAMPGGFVVVNTGLIAAAQSAEEVAGVLAHEIAHVEQRHSLRAIAQSLGLAAALSLVFGDTSGLASMGGELLKLGFSRANELDADREGLKYLVRANIRPDGMKDFFRRMAGEVQFVPAILSTHPAGEDRFEAIDRLIAALPAAAREAPPLSIDFPVVKAALEKEAPKEARRQN